MSMTERVIRLRQESLEAVPTLSAERARLMTEFYRQEQKLTHAAVHRALAFQYLMQHKTIFLGDGELIVGEKGPTPKATPTYPELCCHSLEDLDILNSREKVPFAVTPQDRKLYEDTIIPFWEGRSMRDLIFRQMTSEWLDAYEAGIFTEFMEQRSPGHTVLDGKIYDKGLVEFKRDIERSLAHLGYLNDQVDLGLATRHVAHLGGLVEDLVHTHAEEVPEGYLNDGPAAGHGSSKAAANDGRLGDRGIPHPEVPKLLP